MEDIYVFIFCENKSKMKGWIFVLVFVLLKGKTRAQMCDLGSDLETIGTLHYQTQTGSTIRTVKKITATSGSYTFVNVNSIDFVITGSGGSGGASGKTTPKGGGGGGGGAQLLEYNNILLSTSQTINWNLATAMTPTAFATGQNGLPTTLTVSGTVFYAGGGGGGGYSYYATVAPNNGGSGGGGSSDGLTSYTGRCVTNSAKRCAVLSCSLANQLTGCCWGNCGASSDGTLAGGGGGFLGAASSSNGGSGYFSPIANMSLAEGGNGGTLRAQAGGVAGIARAGNTGHGGHGGTSGSDGGGALGGKSGSGAFYIRYSCTQVLVCPNNTYMNGSVCTANSGYYLSGSGVSAIACPANSYCPAGSTSPTACPLSTISQSGASNVNDCFYPISTVNFSVKINNFSFSVDDLRSNVLQRQDLGLNITFDFLEKSNVFVEAKACPAGFVCPVDSLTGIACVKGTYNNLTNAFSNGQCNTCPVGYYCPEASVNPTRCPIYTTSLQGQDNILQCTCLAGYYCTYGKRIFGRVTLNMSASAFDESMQSKFKKAIAASAGVTESDVVILGVNTGSLGRRMLSVDSRPSGRLLGLTTSVHIQVLNAESLRDLKKHVDMHCGEVHVEHEWWEKHSVVASPLTS